MVSFVGFVAFGGFFVLSHPILKQIVFPQCSPDERSDYAVPGDRGYTVSYYLKDCGIIGSAWVEGLYAERSRFPWPWPERNYIFRYKPYGYFGSINVIPTGPNTVTVSTEHLSEVFWAETNWGMLKIDYNIGSIEYPRPTDPVTVGEAWAEREKALVEHARRHGIRTSVNPAP